MKKSLIFYFYIILCAFLFNQCRQPRVSPQGSSKKGAKLFLQFCSGCHSDKGIGGQAPGQLNAPDIRQFTKTPSELELIIINGFGKMPAFKDSTSADNIAQIANYVAAQIENRTSTPKN